MFGIKKKKEKKKDNSKIKPKLSQKEGNSSKKESEKKPIISFSSNKKKVVPRDYTNDILDFLERIEVIQNIHNSFSTKHQMHNMKWDNTVHESKRDIKQINAELKFAKEKIDSLKVNFRNIIMSFKDCALPEDYEKLKNRIDRWNVDEFIGNDEFKRWIRESKN